MILKKGQDFAASIDKDFLMVEIGQLIVFWSLVIEIDPICIER